MWQTIYGTLLWIWWFIRSEEKGIDFHNQSCLIHSTNRYCLFHSKNSVSLLNTIIIKPSNWTCKYNLNVMSTGVLSAFMLEDVRMIAKISRVISWFDGPGHPIIICQILRKKTRTNRVLCRSYTSSVITFQIQEMKILSVEHYVVTIKNH